MSRMNSFAFFLLAVSSVALGGHVRRGVPPYGDMGAFGQWSSAPFRDNPVRLTPR
jgi:hypothetical protein